MAYADAQKDGVIKYGDNPSTIKVMEAVKVGDALGYSSGWYKADNLAASLIHQRCVAGEDGAAEQEITAYFGTVILGGERLSGGTRGNKLYVSNATDGKYTETISTTPTDGNKVVGYMITTIEAVLNPNAIADSVVA